MVTNYLVGLIGAYYQPLGPVAFWALHACLPAISLAALLAAYKPLKSALGDPVREVPAA